MVGWASADIRDFLALLFFTLHAGVFVQLAIYYVSVAAQNCVVQ